MLTLMAIKHFQQSGVEYGVLEAGLGGRIDATSGLFLELFSLLSDLTAIEHKLVSIVSSVALDHTHILGHTIPQIAAEKAGVFKGAECGVVGSSMHADAQAVLHQVAADLGVRLVQAEVQSSAQLQNKATARAVLEQLHVQGHVLSDRIQPALDSMPPCRFQEFKTAGGQLIILDVAHNPAAFTELLCQAEARFGPNVDLRIVLTLSHKKALTEIFRVISQSARVTKVHLSQASCSGKVASLEDMAAAAHAVLEPGRIVRSEQSSTQLVLAEAVEAVKVSGSDQVLLVCGSFVGMCQALDFVGCKTEPDPIELH
eukprot:TRINITY_DN6128_c0_g1_i15.p1 TRINITY_DN6128_c0_g1~~TRINITY_DN6128_c0_g1_i15.p1  ORF type:complete len:314 (+),score=38.07 TRINITY_DN6128_c0_g1_i15:331-1272(+)